MKIYIRGKLYNPDDDILIIYLEDKDKENIKNMNPKCKVYSEFDEKRYDINKVIQLLSDVRTACEKRKNGDVE